MNARDLEKKVSSSLKKRLISAFVLAPLVVALIVLGDWYFIVFIAVAWLLSLYEFIGLAYQGSRRYLHMFVGIVYLVACFGAFTFIRFSYEQGAWLTLAVILCVWASDTGAYVAGKTIGGPKMAPNLSPNKTWAGLGGAMFFCGLALLALQCAGNYIPALINTDLGLLTSDIPLVFAIGLLVGLVGQAGDLFISFYKRRVGAKDTGQLIPGHGGLLDRIDALLLVSPVFLGILLLWM